MIKYFKKTLLFFLSAIFIASFTLVSYTNAVELPSKFITEAKTPVLDQKNNPLCWAYTGSDMLSINAIKNGYAENGNTVFSAAMMARAEFDGNEHRHNGGRVWYKCYGGIDYALMAAISGKGLLYNSEYPTVSDADKAPVSTLYSGEFYVDNIKMTDISELARKDRTMTIKKYIYEYGAVSAEVFVGNYNSVTKVAHIDTFDNTKASHAVLLVGWDDNKYTDTGTGAFLMKNTWGESWGDNGYAWISYNSEFGRQVYAANVVFDADAKILTHTETIFTSGNSSNVSDGEFGAVNTFSADEKMTLYKAGVYTDKPSSDIKVRVYINLNDISNIASASPNAVAEGNADDEGYYTFDLNNHLTVDKGDTVTVLYLIKSGDRYYVFSEYSDPDFEMTVTEYKPGQSYTYSDGQLKEPKGNYIGTVICKTEHKEPEVTETEFVTETEKETEIFTETETEYQTENNITSDEIIIVTEIEDTETKEFNTDTSLSYENTIVTDDTGSNTDITDTSNHDDNNDKALSKIKRVFITIIIIVAVVVVLFILLILALIAASKKKKV